MKPIKAGDRVICRDARHTGNFLTRNKEYVALHCEDSDFVVVVADNGCVEPVYAYRFEVVKGELSE